MTTDSHDTPGFDSQRSEPLTTENLKRELAAMQSGHVIAIDVTVLKKLIAELGRQP